MRRQVGATTVDIDTIEGYARYTIGEPRRIDFGAIEEAAHDAGYTLTGLTLTVTGRVEEFACDVCDDDVLALRLPGTGQRLEVQGDLPPPGETARVTVSVSSWAGGHPRIRTVP